MPYTTLRLDSDGRIATVTLDRAEKRNAISAAMIADVIGVLDEIAAGPARAAILTGAGKAFCSGMDLEALRAIATQSAAQNLDDSRRMAALFRALYAFPRPLIAAVNGAALAGGCGIATLCDLTLAVPQATFGYTEVRIGFIPAVVSAFLVRQVGEKRARELLLLGNVIGAEEAQRLGLVTEIVPAERLLPRAQELAQALAANSPASLERTKRLLRSYSESEMERDLEQAIQENAAIRSTAEFREGLSAFLEKRTPKF